MARTWLLSHSHEESATGSEQEGDMSDTYFLNDCPGRWWRSEKSIMRTNPCERGWWKWTDSRGV